MNPIATYKFDRPLHNEDAPAIATDRFLIVCDGLGAGGQNKHTINGETHTSAYYGSRLLSEICKEFYDKNYSVIMKSVSDKEALNRIVEELKTTIKNRLNQFVEENRLTKTIKGKSIKLLPSTLSSILYKVNDSSIDVVVISAGDTRAFSLSPQYGLQQLSKDDVDEDVDAFEKATIVNNNICQDRDFTLNFRSFRINHPSILFVCSDGCYDYFSSPMEVEYIIDASFVRFYSQESAKNGTFGENLGDYIAKLSKLQDDCSMAAVIIGFDNELNLKKDLKTRAVEMETKYMKPFHALDMESKKIDGKYDSDLKETKIQMISFDRQIHDEIALKVKKLIKCYLLDKPINDSDTEIMNRILADEQFQAFLDDLSKAEIEREESKKQKEEEKDLVYVKLREEFSRVYTNDYQGRNIYSNRGMIPSFIYDPAADLLKEEQRFQRILDSYKRRLQDFDDQFEYIKNATPQQIYENRATQELSRRYQLFWNDLNALMGSENRIRGLKPQVSVETVEVDENSISDAFSLAWRSGFSHYRKATQYREVCTLYDQCKSLLDDLKNYEPFSEKDKLDLFEKYYQQKGTDLVNAIIKSFGVKRLAEPDIYEKLMNCKKKYQELEGEASRYVKQKYSLWSEYKTGYEMYDKAICYGVI